MRKPSSRDSLTRSEDGAVRWLPQGSGRCRIALWEIRALGPVRLARSGAIHFSEDAIMLWTIAVILLILWVLGFFVVHVGGGLIHLLLVIAVIVIIYRLITGRPVV